MAVNKICSTKILQRQNNYRRGMNDIFKEPVVVIDNGCYNIKAGFSSDNHPLCIFRNIVGRPKYLNGSLGNTYYDVYIGDEAMERKAELDFSYPVVNGKIVNWDDMERVWHHIFYKALRVAPEERAIMFADSPIASMQDKCQTCEIFFETLNAPGLCIASQSVLSVYGSGFVTGICVDVGYDSTDINPVFEGGMIRYAHLRTSVAGSQVGKYIEKSLAARGFDFGIHTDDVVEGIKKECCYVMKDPSIPRKKRPKKKYTLHTGEEIDVTNEAADAPELLFQPKKWTGADVGLSLPTAIENTAIKCDPDLRNTLYQAIIPCGGLATLPGMNDRLKSELEKLTGRSVYLTESSESYCIDWLGASAFSGLNDVAKVWVSQAQYLEEGERVVRYKFY